MHLLEYIPYICVAISFAFVALSYAFRKSIANFFIKYSAKAKLIIIALCSIVSLLTIVIVESAFMKEINIELTSIAERDLPLIEKLTKVEFELLESNIFFEKSINSHLLGYKQKSDKYKKESINLLDNSLSELNKIVSILDAFSSESELESEIKEFKYVQESIGVIIADIAPLVNQKAVISTEIGSLPNDKFMDLLENTDSKAIQLERQLEEILVHFEKYAEKTAFHAEELEINALNTALALSILLLAFLVTLLYMISQSIVNPIISEVSRINRLIEPSIDMSSDCLRLSDDLSSSSIQQLESITETSAACEQIAQTLKVNLDQTENGKNISVQASQSIESTLTSLTDLIDSVESLKKSNEGMSQFLDIVGTIKDKTAVIDEIVLQTKLLSFNASVEAERAGEQGRGFSVVAKEVGTLAKNSGKSSIEISEIITDSTKKVENSINENKKNMNNAIKKLENVSSQCAQVKDDIERLASTNSAISNTSKEQSIGVNQVNEAILSIHKNADIINLNAKELSQFSRQIVSNTSELSSSSEILSVIAFGNKNNYSPDSTTEPVEKNNVVSLNTDTIEQDEANDIPNDSSANKKIVNSNEDSWDNI